MPKDVKSKKSKEPKEGKVKKETEKKEQRAIGSAPIYTSIEKILGCKLSLAAAMEKSPNAATKAVNFVTMRWLDRCLESAKEEFSPIGYEDSLNKALDEGVEAYRRRLISNKAKHDRMQASKDAKAAKLKEEGGGKKSKKPKKIVLDEAESEGDSESDSDLDSESCESDSEEEDEE